MIRKMHYFNITYICDSNCKFCAANIGLIDSNAYTMRPDEVEIQLLRENVNKGDIVMISGGEPSLSPSFWEILDVCRKYECYIELTTNGHLFSDIKLAKKLYKYENVNVQIPIFGTERQHDYLTGCKGAFFKTIQALDNFSQLMKSKSFTVSIKFLLCKATVEGNRAGYDYLKRRYGAQFLYFLNVLLVSDKVKMNSAELLEPYSITISKLGDFIEYDDIRVDTVPLCLLSEQKRNAYLKQKHFDLLKIYTDAKVFNKDMNNYSGEKCDMCRVKKYCDRFLPSYIDYFGDGEITPL